MSYATPEQFIRAFSEREARTLTDENMTGFIDEEKLASALARASAQIDGYLVGRYRTPWPDSPGIVVGYCCDIARYHLATDYRISSEEIQMRYRDAIRFLEKVAAGQINLGRDTSGSVIQSSSQVRIPDTNEPDWESLEGVKISLYPLSNSGKRTSYLDCFTTEVGEKYTVDNEAKIDIKMAALRKVEG